MRILRPATIGLLAGMALALSPSIALADESPPSLSTTSAPPGGPVTATASDWVGCKTMGVGLSNLNAGAPLATCRLWAAPDRVGAVQRAIVQDAHIALDEAGLQPTEVVRTIPPETDPSRLL